MLARHKAGRIVVAHSPLQVRRIITRVGGTVVLIDTGMLASTYKGRPSALEIAGNDLFAIYEDGRVPLVPGNGPSPDPSPSPPSRGRAGPSRWPRRSSIP
jgi:hypothetical protein